MKKTETYGPANSFAEKQAKYYKSVIKIQQQMRKGSWTYLCRHPEIRAIIRVILNQAINENPVDVFQFAADLFNCNKTNTLVSMVNEQLKRVNDQLKKGCWSEFDGGMFFTESSGSMRTGSSSTIRENPLLAIALIDKSDECKI